MKVQPTTAFCAIGPDGTIDLDMIRRSASSARGAATAIKSTAWPALAAKGWVIVPVRITAAGEPEEEAVPLPPKPPAPRPAVERRPAGGVKLLRCGALEPA